MAKSYGGVRGFGGNGVKHIKDKNGNDVGVFLRWDGVRPYRFFGGDVQKRFKKKKDMGAWLKKKGYTAGR